MLFDLKIFWRSSAPLNLLWGDLSTLLTLTMLAFPLIIFTPGIMSVFYLMLIPAGFSDIHPGHNKTTWEKECTIWYPSIDKIIPMVQRGVWGPSLSNQVSPPILACPVIQGSKVHSFQPLNIMVCRRFEPLFYRQLPPFMAMPAFFNFSKSPTFCKTFPAVSPQWNTKSKQKQTHVAKLFFLF